MYGDSIFESLLGNYIGQASANWADIAEVWTRYPGSSKSMVLAISGVSIVRCAHVLPTGCTAESLVSHTAGRALLSLLKSLGTCQCCLTPE